MSELPLASRKTVEEQIKAKAKSQYAICNNECIHTAADCRKCERKFLVPVKHVLAVVNADQEAHNKQLLIAIARASRHDMNPKVCKGCKEPHHFILCPYDLFMYLDESGELLKKLSELLMP